MIIFEIHEKGVETLDIDDCVEEEVVNEKEIYSDTTDEEEDDLYEIEDDIQHDL